MAENEANPLPAYLLGKQFTTRINETERANAGAFIQTFFEYGKPPATAREFFNTIMAIARDLHGKQAPANTEEVNALKAEIENLKDENVRLKTETGERTAIAERLANEVIALKEKLAGANAPAPEQPENELSNLPATKEAPLGDIRLFFLSGYRESENQTVADLILKMKEAYDNTITGIMHNPLRLLEDVEYQALLKWDNEVFLPGIAGMLTDEIAEVKQLKAIYGDSFDIKKLLTSKHKFYLFWDFVMYDPAEKLEALIPGLTQEQKDALQEMRFPRFPAVRNVLLDLIQKANETHDTTEPVQEEASTPGPGSGGEEGGRVMSITGDTAAETTGTVAGEDKPK